MFHPLLHRPWFLKSRGGREPLWSFLLHLLHAEGQLLRAGRVTQGVRRTLRSCPYHEPPHVTAPHADLVDQTRNVSDIIQAVELLLSIEEVPVMSVLRAAGFDVRENIETLVEHLFADPTWAKHQIACFLLALHQHDLLPLGAGSAPYFGFIPLQVYAARWEVPRMLRLGMQRRASAEPRVNRLWPDGREGFDLELWPKPNLTGLCLTMERRRTYNIYENCVVESRQAVVPSPVWDLMCKAIRAHFLGFHDLVLRCLLDLAIYQERRFVHWKKEQDHGGTADP